MAEAGAGTVADAGLDDVVRIDPELSYELEGGVACVELLPVVPGGPGENCGVLGGVGAAFLLVEEVLGVGGPGAVQRSAFGYEVVRVGCGDSPDSCGKCYGVAVGVADLA